MKVTFESLGNVDKAELELNDLMIFTGQSNSGKTYLNYALYALLDRRYRFISESAYFHQLVVDLNEKGTITISLQEMLDELLVKITKAFEKNFAKNMPRFFSAPSEHFDKFKVNVLLNAKKLSKELHEKPYFEKLRAINEKAFFQIVKEKNSDIITFLLNKDDEVPLRIYVDFVTESMYRFILKDFYNQCFILPSERSGLNLFYPELNSQRNSLINHLQKNKINPLEVMQDLIISKYPQPIADYIDFLNNAQFINKNKSDLSVHSDFLRKSIVSGRYKVDKDGIQFLPYKNNKIKNPSQRRNIDLHLASSTAKTLFSLDVYIQSLASVGGYLIIDEPELNLHPDNQRKLARLLVRLVNVGVNVIVSTHSDYIIKEINNLIMLSEDFNGRDELMAKYGYDESEVLAPAKVSPYLVKDGNVLPMEINLKEGIIASTFDEVINQLNESSDDIFYKKLDSESLKE